MTQQSPIKEAAQQITETENTVFIEDKKSEGVPPQSENTPVPAQQEKKETEVEVKRALQDEDIPVEPVLGNDGIEVGGEG